MNIRSCKEKKSNSVSILFEYICVCVCVFITVVDMNIDKCNHFDLPSVFIYKIQHLGIIFLSHWASSFSKPYDMSLAVTLTCSVSSLDS